MVPCHGVRLRLGYGTLALLSAACGGNLPQPSFMDQPRDGYQPVPYPPPACLAEVVPPTGDARLVWFDGYWVWRGRGYVWRRGGWVLPMPGARYARWHLRYGRDGQLGFAEGTWYDAHGRKLKAPRVVIPARTPPNVLTSEHDPY